MGQYAKPWLSIEDQIDRLIERGVEVTDRDASAHLLRTVGYYRLTGYLYPFRQSETYRDDQGREKIRVLSLYRSGTSIAAADELIGFDRQLRLHVLDGIERIEIALRTHVGHVLGRSSAFAHLDEATFVDSFTEAVADPETGSVLSKHQEWIGRMRERQDGDEQTSKQVFGLYNILAVMAYLLRSIDLEGGWARRMSELLLTFPESKHLTVRCMGVHENWEDQALWC